MKEYTLADGRKLQSGPFTYNGYQFPPNWFELATADDLSHWGISVADIPDPPAQPDRWSVSTYRIVRRLEAAGLIDAAEQALANNKTLWRRFYTVGSVPCDDPDAVAFLEAIGADPSQILAKE